MKCPCFECDKKGTVHDRCEDYGAYYIVNRINNSKSFRENENKRIFHEFKTDVIGGKLR